MPIINHRTKEIKSKIVYCGPSLGGKTTNIKCLHGALPEDLKSDLQIIDTHEDRTLFFDYFSLEVATVNGMRTRFLVYGVPGQDYYRSMRKMVLQGADGIVFVADSSRGRLEQNIQSLNDMKALLAEHGYDYQSMPLVLQFNKRDLPDICTPEELNAALNDRDDVKTYDSVAIDGTGVRETFQGVCSAVINKLKHDLSMDR